jgi:hypothetical protein
MNTLRLLAQELLAYARQADEAAERLNLNAVQSLAANAGRKALELQEEADSLNRIAAQEAFRDPGEGEHD